MKIKGISILNILFFFTSFSLIAHTVIKDTSYCETLNKVIKLYKEGQYTALYKAKTEQTADENSFYDLEYEAEYPLTLFTKSYMLKEKDLKPAVYAVRFYFKGEIDEATGIYDKLKGCFSDWTLKEESNYYEEESDVIFVNTYTYTKDGVKVRFYITESDLYSVAELKIDRD